MYKKRPKGITIFGILLIIFPVLLFSINRAPCEVIETDGHISRVASSKAIICPEAFNVDVKKDSNLTVIQFKLDTAKYSNLALYGVSVELYDLAYDDNENLEIRLAYNKVSDVEYDVILSIPKIYRTDSLYIKIKALADVENYNGKQDGTSYHLEKGTLRLEKRCLIKDIYSNIYNIDGETN